MNPKKFNNPSLQSIHLAAPFLYHGGAEKQFRYLIEALVQSGTSPTIHILSSRSIRGIDDNEFDNKILSRCTIIYHKNDVLNFNRNPASWIKALFKLFLGLKNANTVYFYTAYFLPIIPILKLFGKRVIFSERILSERTIRRLSLYKIAKLADNFVVNGDSLKDFFEGNGFKNITLIRNRVEPIKWNSDLSPRRNFAILSRYDPYKNIAMPIMALSKNSKWTINVYGEGGGIYYDELSKIAEKSKCSVSLNGQTLVNEIYNGNYLIVHPSLAEGTPNVLLEAMISRKPIIASSIRENKDTGIHAECLFDPSNPDAFSEFIENAVSLDAESWEVRLDHNERMAKARYSQLQFQKAIDALFFPPRGVN